MKLLNRLERRLGRYAIQNLMKYIIIIYGVGLVLDLLFHIPTYCYVWILIWKRTNMGLITP